MKETSELIKQAQTEYDGMYLVDTRVHFIIVCSRSVLKLMFLVQNFKNINLTFLSSITPGG